MFFKKLKKSYTYDDVLLIPNYSEIIPNNVDVSTKLGKSIILKAPIISAAMDTVTESQMAIAVALAGGFGVIHKNLPPEKQAAEVKKVHDYKVDLNKYPDATFNSKKQLLACAAISAGKTCIERVEQLMKVDVDVVSIDCAHGDSYNAINAIKIIRNKYPNLMIIAGNIATKKAAKHLIAAGADCIKVGIGPGSICTTRIVSGVGVPQLTAIKNVYKYAKRKNISVIADGGLKYSGDITKALAAGANCVMLGGILAATTQAPGEIIEINNKKYKEYVGMGSLVAMQRGSKDRYFQDNITNEKLVPEGVEAYLEYKGDVSNIIYQMIGGLKSGMGYCGACNIDQLHKKAKFTIITTSGVKESHTHDLDLTKKAPNYGK